MPKRLVYLDNAATTPVRPEVLEAMLPYLGPDAFGNPSSPHRFGRAARAGVEEAKRSIAAALAVDPGQVIFTSGGTEADNLAVIGCALAARERGGPFRVAVSAIEHKAVLAAARAVGRPGGGEGSRPGDGEGEGSWGSGRRWSSRCASRRRSPPGWRRCATSSSAGCSPSCPTR